MPENKSLNKKGFQRFLIKRWKLFF